MASMEYLKQKSLRINGSEERIKILMDELYSLVGIGLRIFFPVARRGKKEDVVNPATATPPSISLLYIIYIWAFRYWASYNFSNIVILII